MKAVVLEGNAVNTGDISWDPITRLCDTTIFGSTTEADKREHLAGARIVLANKVILDEAVFEEFPEIRYVGECATGVNNVDLEAARSHGVTVTNVPAYSTDSVVQHTFALLLEISDQVALHDQSVKAGDWVRSELFCYWKTPLVELAGKNLGIVGFGHIGQGVARVASALGMNVIVNTKHPEKHCGPACDTVSFVGFDELIEESDIISLHCPLTDQTRGMIDAGSISRMRDGVVLLNLARGPLVVEADLAAALESGKVAAAGVDVVDQEPMLKDNPLLGAPHIIFTPHIAWATREARTRLVEMVADNLRAWLDGIPQNVVV